MSSPEATPQAPPSESKGSSRPPSERSISIIVASVDGVPAASVDVGFVHLSAFYRGLFGDPRFVAPLGTALGPCVSGVAPVVVAWEQARLRGSIGLRATEALSCLPTPSDERVDLTPLRPVGVALSAYRDGIAHAFDVRVASFEVEVEVGECTLQPVGQLPPDGSTWSRCVRSGGKRACDEGDPTVGVTELHGPAADMLRRCLADHAGASGGPG